MVESSTSTPSTPAKRGKAAKKSKAVRRLQFDEDKSSPVSGTIIRDIGSVRDERNQLLKEDKFEQETPIGIQVSSKIVSFCLNPYEDLLSHFTSNRELSQFAPNSLVFIVYLVSCCLILIESCSRECR